MSKRQWLMLIGVFLALFQFYAGFPSSSLWGKIAGAALGLVIAAIAYKLKPEPSSKPMKPMPFVDAKGDEPPVGGDLTGHNDNVPPVS